MKNCWSILLLAVILQSLTLSILAGHHGHGSNIAHILAAGLIVQLLSRSGHHHQSARHGGGGLGMHSQYSPYGQASWLEESRMTPESTLASSSWAQRAPLDLAYQQSSYKEPLMESYNVPYYYQNPQPAGIW